MDSDRVAAFFAIFLLGGSLIFAIIRYEILVSKLDKALRKNMRLSRLLWDGIHIMPHIYGQRSYDGGECWFARTRAELGDPDAPA
jgi:hypothetical protein